MRRVNIDRMRDMMQEWLTSPKEEAKEEAKEEEVKEEEAKEE